MDSPYHERARDIIERDRIKRERFLASAVIASSFVSIVTNPPIFREPSDLAEAWRFLEFIEADPLSQYAIIDAETYALYKHLSLVSDAKGMPYLRLFWRLQPFGTAHGLLPPIADLAVFRV